MVIWVSSYNPPSTRGSGGVGCWNMGESGRGVRAQDPGSTPNGVMPTGFYLRRVANRPAIQKHTHGLPGPHGGISCNLALPPWASLAGRALSSPPSLVTSSLILGSPPTAVAYLLVPVYLPVYLETPPASPTHGPLFPILALTRVPLSVKTTTASGPDPEPQAPPHSLYPVKCLDGKSTSNSLAHSLLFRASVLLQVLAFWDGPPNGFPVSVLSSNESDMVLLRLPHVTPHTCHPFRAPGGLHQLSARLLVSTQVIISGFWD